MDAKALVTLRKPQEAQVVRDSGCRILAEYPDSILVRCDQAQLSALKAAGLELSSLPEPPVQVSGQTFAFERALAAEDRAPTQSDPGRTAYYLVKLVGPAKSDWLEAIRAAGGKVQGSLPGFALLVGILPAGAERLAAQPWVEGVAPYRPAMKLSPKLNSMRLSPQPGVLELARVQPPGSGAAAPEQVEISLFPGEGTAGLAARIRTAGGLVLSESEDRVIAVVAPALLAEIAGAPGVQSILPHQFPKFLNDRATEVLGLLPDRTFLGLTLAGDGQIIAIADSGLDSGNPARLHPDIAGRVDALLSLPVRASLLFFANDPPGADDGPPDVHSGHGTHVAGSALGSGAAAASAMPALPAERRPAGVAPAAHLYFQAIEQEVHWKTQAELLAQGVPSTQLPPNWPPAAVGLWGLPDSLALLFNPAYEAGARIHSNSWGASGAGVYDGSARQVDDFVWTHRDMLILFAAGNEGVDADGDGFVDPDSLNTPSTAKNCLTVGASENNRPHGSSPTPGFDAAWTAITANGVPLYPALGLAGHVSDNIDGMAAFSSRGPTDDGRTKPDLVVPGTNILSLRSGAFVPAPAHPYPLWGDLEAGHPLRDCYCWSGGTSMSTPIVAGAAALVRQYLIQSGHFAEHAQPSSALLKAFLVTGAVTLNGQYPGEVPAGPNSVAGFGRLDLATVLAEAAAGRVFFADRLDDAVESGQIRVFEVQAADASRPLKVTLAWTDAPSPLGVGGLQNRLYLQVVRPDGVVLDGDVTAFPVATNNVQQVLIRAPGSGVYQCRVRGVSVFQHAPGVAAGPNPRQDFALVAANALGGAAPAEPFLVDEIFIRRNVSWPYTLIGVRVLRDGAPAAPAGDLSVAAFAVQGSTRLESGPLEYYPFGRYFRWRIPTSLLKPGPATISAQVSLNGTVVAAGGTTQNL